MVFDDKIIRHPPVRRPGLEKEHEITRIDPDSGGIELRTITQAEWKEKGKQLRAEGWKREEEEPAEEPESEPEEEI